MPETLPFGAIIPTRNRAAALGQTLESLASQSAQPAEVIIVDASEDGATRALCSAGVTGLVSKLTWQAAEIVGAAHQRNQGVAACSRPVIGFFDDDIRFEPMCVARLWAALDSDSALGGVNAMIVNQRYQPPGRMSRFMFRLMAGKLEPTYAGRVLGPAVNLLPEDRDDLPEVVPVEWLNTTCTLYRRQALPMPPFPDHFTGYSLMEDVTLSLMVGKRWKLANARTARIFHDSQPGSHKSDPRLMARMHLLNRHYVMKQILGRDGFRDHCKLAVWLAFSHLSSFVQTRGGGAQWARLHGEWQAYMAILSRREPSTR